MSAELPDSADVLIVGAGPCGATIARRVLDSVPTARVLVVDAGPRLGDRTGINVRNLRPVERAAAEAVCAMAESGPRSRSVPSGGAIEARPGTHLLMPTPRVLGDDVPAAAYSSNLGGMAAFWTCASPRPGGSERITCVPQSRMDGALAASERLLRVTANPYPPSAVADSIRNLLEDTLGLLVEGERPIQPMPMACTPSLDGKQPAWSGVDTILGTGPCAQVAPNTLCRRVWIRDGSVTGTLLEDRRTGAQLTVRCRFVVVAAGAFHTPQLLWTSDVRPVALGRYLNVHSQVVATVSTTLPGQLIEPPLGDDREHLRAIYWVPFNDRSHPWHGQVHVTEPPCTDAAIVGLAWYVPKAVTSQCRVEFVKDRLDMRGLPAPSVVHWPTPADDRMTAQAISTVSRVASAIGPYVSNGAPRVLATGKSLHYQGTTRMGPLDDDTSVCDTTGQVWGTLGLYVAGPSVIPTATACNPTLTAVALAAITADEIARNLVSS